MAATLEHANVTVSDPDATARWMGEVFGWHVRWSGAAMGTGRSVHVGNTNSYLALYSPGKPSPANEDSYSTIGGLNHLAVTVNNIDAVHDKVVAAGFTPGEHFDYEPGQRFYFNDTDGIEYEVVQYD